MMLKAGTQQLQGSGLRASASPRVMMPAQPRAASQQAALSSKPALLKGINGQQAQRAALQVRRAAAAEAPSKAEGAARPIFPFTAIVGQEEMKLSLILNVIDPKIGGVMIMGDRGTGKSTTIRALADLLPEIQVVAKDAFNSDPADPEVMSEEVGGVKAFEPGLLAKANRGILYVDEVNLLDDHLVDVLLDSAASGWNTVEREGISISHPARFILVGSGNPEEGELRPQLLDRFGMHAQIGTVREPELRVQIVTQRSEFDDDPAAFRKDYLESQAALTNKIVDARKLVKQADVPYDYRVKVSQICSELNVDGIRGDIVTNRAAKALAAFEGRTEVTPGDIYRVIPLCLRHRLRKDPLAEIDSGDKVRWK
ncbi:magnesium chelatase subunit of protochlorophyllide reductase [Dunaliella salina]|uniref:magnesium chelatase n=1 Tax=Dunaliella salina TaxID=3046 RepID=A0ABQ7H852_DUNSA|nr:magnesium chelatase subunit of protochlorophyllide reductase [Dunaliella salina]|eukprot:KAF5843028.1 magnesium chelatase subunit of protochlorophyllide reductase [Dunaliella salina]